MNEITKAGRSLGHIRDEVCECRKCERLVGWRERVAREKVARFKGEVYWGKPVPGFGDGLARLLVVGLAPAAHGANRTGRMFTGDRSGEWLYRSLHEFGFATQYTSSSRDDGMRLVDCYITAAARCAPPANKLLPQELMNCRSFLLDEMRCLGNVSVVVCLGKIAWESVLDSMKELGRVEFKSRPSFSHGAETEAHGGILLLASYHPSQQNTFTGRLTKEMFDGIFKRARERIGRT